MYIRITLVKLNVGQKNTTPLSASGKTNKQVEFVCLSLRYLSAQNGSF